MSGHDDVGAAVAAAAQTVRAPAGLRRQVLAAHADRPSPVPRLALAGAAVALLAAVVLLAGGAAGPTVGQVAAAALAAPERPATPAEERFTAWGWRATGARDDRVGGRQAETVIYRRGDLGVHYTVVDGAPLSPPEGARAVRAGDLRLSVIRDAGGANVVSWRRSDGRTCVLSSRLAGPDVLVRFASWE